MLNFMWKYSANLLAGWLLTVTLLGSGLCAQDAEDRRKVIVCSTTQIADFARQIVGDDWDVRCVLSPGQDPHRYEVKPSDSRLVAGADLCAQNGWNLEGHQWMENLAEAANVRLINCVTGVKAIDLDEDGEQVQDPHAWFDPRSSAIYVKNILNAVVEVDPDNKEKFEARAQLYLSQLAALHTWIQRQVSAIPANKRVLVTHHDAFGYFCEAYGFRSESPAGWTTEELSGISIERRQDVIDTIRELGVKSIFLETSLDFRTISEIANDAGVEIGGTLYSDAMGSEGTAGETYIGMMRENVLTIVEGLK